MEVDKNNFEEIDLTEELTQPTEIKVETTDTTTPIVVDEKDFDKIPDPEELKDKVLEKTDVLYDSTQLAPSVVEAIDALQTAILPKVFEWSMTDEDKAALKALSVKIRGSRNEKETTFNNDELRVVGLYDDYEEYKESLPFTEKEKLSLSKPLAEMLKDVDYQTTPTNAFLIAVVLILIPRLLPVGIQKMAN